MAFGSEEGNAKGKKGKKAAAKKARDAERDEDDEVPRALSTGCHDKPFIYGGVDFLKQAVYVWGG